MSHMPAGELIVRNGKHRGEHLPMRHPITAIGAGDGCDIKLAAEGIDPLHCIVAITADGPVLRAVVGDSVKVNGEPRSDSLLVDGDEVQIGPCVLQVAWTPAETDVLPLAEEWSESELLDIELLRTQAAQLAEHFENRGKQVAELEAELTTARDEFRRNRTYSTAELKADHAEVEKLKEDARKIHKEAEAKRANIGRLTARFIGRAKRKWTAARKELDLEAAALAESKKHFADEAKRFEIARSEFYVSAAAENDRLRDAWATVDAQQKRLSAEWAEANEYFVKQDAAVEARVAELAAREKALAEARGRYEAETTVLRVEAAGLEARIQNARTVVAELEQKRDRLLAELVSPATSTEQKVAIAQPVSLTRTADRDLSAWAAELDAREALLNSDRARIVRAKESLDRTEADFADQRRVLAEQFLMLADARSRWQQAEQRTIAEMEDLARSLGQREQDMDAREQRIIRADARRRDDAFELWQQRLRLEGWQSKLTAFEVAWHTDRAQAEENIARRTRVLGHREGIFGDVVARWEHAREKEQERLRTELQLWATDRERMLNAIGEYDRERQEMQAELKILAARALAAEEAHAKNDSPRDQRRVKVLRKRWEKAFERRVREIEKHRATVNAEAAVIEERYRELHARLADVTEREAALNAKMAKAEEVALEWPTTAETEPSVAPPELISLREELDRLAAVMMEAGLPEVPDGELPWGADDVERELPAIAPQARAA